MIDILILDDDEQITKMAQLMLEREGYSVSATANGEEALRLVEQSPPRLLLTDILMPGLDGIAVINDCRKRFPDLIVAAMSGGRRKITPEFNLKSAAMLGASATLAKPFSKNQLLKMVETVIGP